MATLSSFLVCAWRSTGVSWDTRNLNHDTQTNDLGWVLEALRTDPESVERRLDGFKRQKSRSSVPAGHSEVGTAHS